MQTKHRRLPWVTALVVALAVSAWIAPGVLQEAWIYNRASILHGEIWRLWSGHLIHFSASHLGWNLLVVGLTGIWIERAGFCGGRWLFIISPLCISLTLLIWAPSLDRYGGLSGMATASTAFACLSEWRRNTKQAALWFTALALVGIKIGWEFFSGHSVFAHFDERQVQAVPLSHLAGVVAAVIIWLTWPCMLKLGNKRSGGTI
jgi:rhomboid family GlyGly-CTERM serine protease